MSNSWNMLFVCNPFDNVPSKVLIDDEFLISDGIVFHITGPEYDKLFLNKLILGFGI